MAVIQTIETIGGRELMHSRSDAGFKIMQDGTGILYDDALDPSDAGQTYTETDEKIEDWKSEDAEAYELAGRILLGEEN